MHIYLKIQYYFANSCFNSDPTIRVCFLHPKCNNFPLHSHLYHCSPSFKPSCHSHRNSFCFFSQPPVSSHFPFLPAAFYSLYSPCHHNNLHIPRHLPTPSVPTTTEF